MITAYEVGALFKIIDEATGPIKKILEQVKALGAEIKTVQEQLKILGTGSTAITELGALAAAWSGVATEMKAAATQMTGAAAAAGRAATVATGAAARPAGAVPIVPGAGRARLAARTGGGAGGGGFGGHIGGAGLPLGGGAHYRPSGVAGILAAALGYESLEKGAEAGEAAWLAQFHLEGGKTTPGMLDKLRQDIQETSSITGFPIKDVGHAFEDVFRQTQGIGGDREAFAKEVVKSASAEARAKGTSLTEATSSLTGFAHQFRDFDVETFKKVLPYIEYLSTTDPRSLKRMMTAGGYAIPTAIEAGVNPQEAVELGAVMASAGITNTKTGTWLRSYIQGGLGAMPLTPRRFGAGRDLGVLDEEGKATALNPDGTLNLSKLQQIIAEHTKGMSPADKVRAFKSMFGEQGAGAAELFNDPVIAERVKQIDAIKDERAAGFAGFQKTFNEGSPLQQFRVALADVNNLFADIGKLLMDGGVLTGLREIDNALKRIHQTVSGGGIGGAAASNALTLGLTGAAAGFVTGGPVGAVVGGAGGAVIGAAKGVGEYGIRSGFDAFDSSLSWLAGRIKELFGGKPTGFPDEGEKAKKMNFLQGPGGEGATTTATNVYLDGQVVGQVVAKQLAAGLNTPTNGSAFYDGTDAAPRSDQSYAFG